MNKITSINPEACKQIRKLVNDKLAEALQELGLKVELGNMTYSSDKVSTKLTVLLADTDSMQIDFALQAQATCFLYGLKPEDYKKRFESNGAMYELVAIKPRRSKYPFVARKVGSNTMYRFPKNPVLSGLKKIA
jgi:hypothetical protein